LEENKKIGLRETGWDAVEWICLAQYKDQWWALVNILIVSYEGLYGVSHTRPGNEPQYLVHM
jgi:hypothetical protein